MTRTQPLDRQAMTGPHSSESFRKIALGGEILRCQVGSGVHGTAIDGYDDRDEMGITLEPPEYVIGLAPHDNPGTVFFEQYIYRTRPEGVRSGPGDLDVNIYSARKWVKLALAGNPTIILPLFVPERDIVKITPDGRDLRRMARYILSRQAADRFAGYLHSQRLGMLSHDGKGRDITRPELIKAYGFDTKYAAHMVRLGVQGLELITTGTITLPIPDPDLTWIRDLRLGRHSMTEALERARELEDAILAAVPGSPLRPEPDRAAMDGWLVGAYQDAWGWVTGE